MGQMNPNPHRGSGQHGHSEHHHAVDSPSPMNFLWGLVLALLTFLLIVICVLSIHWITKLSTPDTPPADTEDVTPPDDPILPDEPATPVMDATSQGQSWSLDHPTATLTFVSNAAFADFENVAVDGTVLVPTTNYTVSEGSTVVTLHAQYLATLSVGIHTVEIRSLNGTATATFEIKEKTPVVEPPVNNSFLMTSDTNTVSLSKKTLESDGIYSDYAILVNLDTNYIVAGRGIDDKMYPASMTKVMTLLVLAEHLKMEDMNQYVTMSADVINYMQSQNASGFGFKIGEQIRVIDLMYAIALESDCAASMQLAIYVAGTHEAFVQMMNDKAKSLGLISTHFENATGLHHNKHVTTCREMATIMAAAMDNEQVKKMLSEKEYKTTTSLYPVTFKSTYFHDVIVEIGAYLPKNGTIIAAKTGYTDEAKCCLATYYESDSGGRYVVITARASNQILYIDDYLYLYDTFTK